MAVEAVCSVRCDLCASRYYVQKKTPFFIGRERYYEITLQLAGAYASKYNRITTYTKENISTGYSIQVGYVESAIDLWGISSRIKVITDWRVSVDPVCLNKLGKVLKMPTRISSQYGEYNDQLDQWERKQGYQIKLSGGFSCIESYEQTTLFILRKLLDFSSSGSKGQREYNQKFLKESSLDFADDLKKQALRDVFANSRLLLIYGAAGTGKTTLINYISNLMANQRKLFLTKTHTALQNLKRRIDNPGTNSDFISIDSFTKQVNLPDYDVIFVDECSTIDNRTMGRFLSKMSPDTFLVLAGDIHQIESIEFGNWFFYAKDIIKTPGANVELLSTWRTQDQALISLWNEVRTRADMITEKLVINGPYSEDIGPNVFKRECEDEVILCLNYDGKFGLNNMNNYFQAANTKGEAIPWAEWSYKVGDPILFNDSKRFDLLYNNLKGRIVDIEKHSGSISFTVHDVVKGFATDESKRKSLEIVKTKLGKN